MHGSGGKSPSPLLPLELLPLLSLALFYVLPLLLDFSLPPLTVLLSDVASLSDPNLARFPFPTFLLLILVVIELARRIASYVYMCFRSFFSSAGWLFILVPPRQSFPVTFCP